MSEARKPGRAQRLALGAALVAAATAPLLVTTPAEAVTTANGCTVRPVRPVAGTTAAGVKIADYQVLYSCAGNRTIQVQQFMMEDDAPPDPDDVTSSQVTQRTFAVANAAQVITRRVRPNTEAGNEEIYQKVRFRVSIGGAPYSAWTAFEPTNTVSVSN